MKSILLIIVVLFTGLFWLSEVNTALGTDRTDYEAITSESELAKDEDAFDYMGNEEEAFIEEEATQNEEEDNDLEYRTEESNEELYEDKLEYKGNLYK